VERINLNDYLDLHNEAKGRKGYTGANPTERTVYTGYGTNSGECATLGRNEVISEHYNFFHSIYHRRPYMDFRAIHFGHYHLKDKKDSKSTTGVTKWGYDFEKKNDNYFIYPTNGSTLVPWAWTEVESPDPFPELVSGTGIPLTVSFTNDKYLDGTITLTDSRGKNVDLLTSRVLPERAHFIEAVPAKELLPNSLYSIHFTYGKQTDSYSFTTAPINPGEVIIDKMVEALKAKIDFRDPKFTVKRAMEVNGTKGKLTELKSYGLRWIVNQKYEFMFILPDGWTVAKPDWQEVHLQNGYSSIHILIQPLGNSFTDDKIYSLYSKNIDYKIIDKTNYRTNLLSGVKVSYNWEYDNQPIVYYLIFGDYAFIVYGYGVTNEMMDNLVNSVKKSTP
jgi:hypothetical protein